MLNVFYPFIGFIMYLVNRYTHQAHKMAQALVAYMYE